MSIMSKSYSPPVYGTRCGCACWRRWRNSRRRRRKVRWVLFLFLFVLFLLELPSARQWYVGWLICCGGAGRAGRARRGGSRRRCCWRSVHQGGVTRFKVVKPVRRCRHRRRRYTCSVITSRWTEREKRYSDMTPAAAVNRRQRQQK